MLRHTVILGLSSLCFSSLAIAQTNDETTAPAEEKPDAAPEDPEGRTDASEQPPKDPQPASEDQPKAAAPTSEDAPTSQDDDDNDDNEKPAPQLQDSGELEATTASASAPQPTPTAPAASPASDSSTAAPPAPGVSTSVDAQYGAAQPGSPADPGVSLPPKARETPLSIYLNLDYVWNLDQSIHLVSDDDVLSRPGLAVSYDVVKFLDVITLAPEIGWNYERADSGNHLPAFHERELTAHHFRAGARARYSLLEWLEPHAQLSGGISLAQIELSSNETFDSNSVSPFGTLGAGVMLHTPPRVLNGFSAGALIEGGYLLASAVDVELDARHEDHLRIPTERASLGELHRSGPYLRMGGFIRF